MGRGKGGGNGEAAGEPVREVGLEKKFAREFLLNVTLPRFFFFLS